MERVILILLLFSFLSGHSQEVDGFTLVRDHILAYGEELVGKKAKNKQDITSVSLITDTRELLYVTLPNREYIRVTRLAKELNLPKYRVVKKGDVFELSAYYSRFDTQGDKLKRKNDWYQLVREAKVAQIPEHLLENFEQGNYHWDRNEIVPAQKAYKKFVDLMKFEGFHDQIPEFVHNRLFRCRLRKL